MFDYRRDRRFRLTRWIVHQFAGEYDPVGSDFLCLAGDPPLAYIITGTPGVHLPYFIGSIVTWFIFHANSFLAATFPEVLVLTLVLSVLLSSRETVTN